MLIRSLIKKTKNFRLALFFWIECKFSIENNIFYTFNYLIILVFLTSALEALVSIFLQVK